MRSEFEKLEEISNLFKIGNFQFNEDECNYTGTKGTALSYLRGSWVMYQHQQSKVDELQKRVDAVKQLIEDYRDPPTEDKTFQHALSIVADELEQALKGEQP
ncbi:hypothetical protein [Acinetobacter junii]|uniref:hypothetical protein n=1 Tax=Acinetobacter junii TaxID=40215 RepID=UPI001250075E|nr:hypothetical protein [Acinetobacter junii]